MIECTVDSVAIIDVLRGKREAQPVILRYSEIGISFIALGELLVGAHKSSDPGELTRTVKVIRGMTLLHGDGNTAVIYAGLRSDLEKHGVMIPQNDLWIAAISIQADVPLVSRDEHFRRIPQLKLVHY